MSKCTNVMFNVQGTMQAPNLTPTVVHGQIFRIVTCKSNIENAILRCASLIAVHLFYILLHVLSS
jgi:hypothetical protein